MDDAIVQLYSGQVGGDLSYFVGKQYGSGWLRTLARFAFPILKRLLGVATNTADDVIMKKKKLFPSLGKNAMNEINNAMSGSALPINRRLKRKYNTSGIDLTGSIYK